MWPTMENIVAVVKLYIQRMQISVLLIYCCAVLQCHRATEPDVTIFLGAVAGFCDEDTEECCSTPQCWLTALGEAT
jgi:hypothetical protein